jgi:hypothetical protein
MPLKNAEGPFTALLFRKRTDPILKPLRCLGDFSVFPKVTESELYL